MVSMFILGMSYYANEDNRIFLAFIGITLIGYSFVKEKWMSLWKLGGVLTTKFSQFYFFVIFFDIDY